MQDKEQSPAGEPETTRDTPLAVPVEALIRDLEILAGDETLFSALTREQRKALMTAAGRIARPDPEERRKRRKAISRMKRQPTAAEDRGARAATGIRSARRAQVFTPPRQISNDPGSVPEGPPLSSPRNCYICKASYDRLHFYYDAMCRACGDVNYAKRFQSASLAGQTALITGARVKIGFQAALKMLRAGARVIATTRFPRDAAQRYAGEPDFPEWKERLHIYGLDLRHTPSVELFAGHVEERYDRLDILVNNAAQTVRRPPGFYAHLLEGETGAFPGLARDLRDLLSGYHTLLAALPGPGRGQGGGGADLPVAWHGAPPGIGLRAPARLSQIPYALEPEKDGAPAGELFPQGRLDEDLQQVDLRTTNSWRLFLGEVPVPEMLEVQLVNSVAPFVLCNRLVAMMKRDYTGCKHIVNVTAMEGKFNRFKQASRHPHTNMAKAALNMLTHTAAAELAVHGIFINAVDTGWVTDEDPAHLARRKQDVHDFEPPLDIVDGAARVCDPFFDGILTGTHWSGKFLKDYLPIDW
jgi:NAD(P)-dependent dehydrogenase (short-subunit alcohol dehydrogenase family)